MSLSALRLTEKLESYYEKKYQNRYNIQVSEVNSLSKGWETELYSFRLIFKEDKKKKEENLIIRLYPGKYADIKTKREFNSLVSLYNAGYTVPKTHILELDENIVGKPFIIMDRIIGIEMGEEFTKALEENDREKIFTKILPRLCKSFVELHNLDWKVIPNEIEDVKNLSPYFFIDRTLKHTKKSLNEYKLQILKPMLKWLKTNRDSAFFEKISILHNDFHPHNIITSSDDGKDYVIDWPSCRVGDYREDLAWSLMLTRAYTSPEISSAVLRLYEKELGSIVKNIEFFEVLSILRRFLDVLIVLTRGAGEVGLRDESIQQIKETMFHLDNIYDRLVEITDIKIPKLTNLLVELSKK